jgi:hypothetical protein
LAFRFHDRWQKGEIFHVTACGLDALSELLDHIVAQFAAQFKCIILENGTIHLSFQQLKSPNYLSLINKHKKFNQFTNSLSGPTSYALASEDLFSLSSFRGTQQVLPFHSPW